MLTNLHTEPRADVAFKVLLVEATEERGGFASAADEAAEGGDGPFLGPQRAGGSVDSTPLPRGRSQEVATVLSSPRPFRRSDSRSSPRQKLFERRQSALQAGEDVRRDRARDGRGGGRVGAEDPAEPARGCGGSARDAAAVRRPGDHRVAQRGLVRS